MMERKVEVVSDKGIKRWDIDSNPKGGGSGVEWSGVEWSRVDWSGVGMNKVVIKSSKGVKRS
jgi:hypothetical protein